MDDYYGSVNPELLEIIPQDTARIVEFGCGSGGLLSVLRERNPDRAFLAMEMEPLQAEKARAKGFDVITGNMEREDVAGHLGQRGWHGELGPDCLIFGDVLEHLYDPWKFLRNSQALVAEGGYLSVCIPNIQHWSVLSGLMRGQFAYQRSGILDVTHIRFFTRSSAENLIEQAGFDIIEMKRRYWENEGAEEFLSNASGLVDDPALQEDMLTLQFVYLARKRK